MAAEDKDATLTAILQNAGVPFRFDAKLVWLFSTCPLKEAWWCITPEWIGEDLDIVVEWEPE